MIGVSYLFSLFHPSSATQHPTVKESSSEHSNSSDESDSDADHVAKEVVKGSDEFDSDGDPLAKEVVKGSPTTTAVATAQVVVVNDPNTSIAPHHINGKITVSVSLCCQSSSTASSCLISFFNFCRPGSSLDGIVEPRNVGIIQLWKMNNNLMIWHSGLPVDCRHIHVGQLKQMLDMLGLIGVPSAPGSKKYVAQDSLMKRINDAARDR